MPDPDGLQPQLDGMADTLSDDERDCLDEIEATMRLRDVEPTAMVRVDGDRTTVLLRPGLGTSADEAALEATWRAARVAHGGGRQ